MRFAVLALLALGVASSKAVEDKNLKTLGTLFEISRELVGKELSLEVIQELQGKIVSFYSPTLKRCAMSPGSKIGIDLKDASLGECFLAAGKVIAGITVTSWNYELAVVRGSEGKKIMSWASPWDFTVTATGKKFSDVQGTLFEFDDAGLIEGFTQEFDTSNFPTGEKNLLAAAPPPVIGATGAVALVATSFSAGLAAMAAFVRLSRRRPEPLLSGY